MGVLIHGNAYYTNLHQDFVMAVGDQRLPFQMAHERQDRYLRFTTDGNTRTLTIDIPKPTAPADDGNSSDTRLLGLALTKIDITELP